MIPVWTRRQRDTACGDFGQSHPVRSPKLFLLSYDPAPAVQGRRIISPTQVIRLTRLLGKALALNRQRKRCRKGLFPGPCWPYGVYIHWCLRPYQVKSGTLATIFVAIQQLVGIWPSRHVFFVMDPFGRPLRGRLSRGPFPRPALKQSTVNM